MRFDNSGSILYKLDEDKYCRDEILKLKEMLKSKNYNGIEKVLNNFWHEGFQIQTAELHHTDNRDNYVQIGLCSCDVKIPAIKLPADFQKDSTEIYNLHRLPLDAWPEALKYGVELLTVEVIERLERGEY